jgi:hypothetical protein
LPAGTAPPKNDSGVVRLEANNIPAFQTEDFMPPPYEVKARVDFIYSEETETKADAFWKKIGKKQNSEVESFIGKKKAMEEAVAQIVAPGDTPKSSCRKSMLEFRRFETPVTNKKLPIRKRSATKPKPSITSKTCGETATATAPKLPGYTLRWFAPPASKLIPC